MSLALLHRRLAILLSLAALCAFAAGAGWGPLLGVTATLLATALFWRAGPALDPWIERAGRVVALGLMGWTAFVLLVGSGDILPPLLAILLVLLVTEALRGLDRGSDMRFYALSFSVFIAATGFQPGIAFGGFFTAYVVLATLTLMVGHLHRQAVSYRIPDPPLRRRHLTLTAGLSLVALAMSVLLFLAFPRLPRSWAGLQGPAGQVMAGFSGEVSLGEHGSRITANNSVALRVEFRDGPPSGVEELHLRGLSFDRFDGVRWSRSPGLPRFHPTTQTYLSGWEGELLHQTVYGAPPGSRAVFGAHPVMSVQARPGMRVRRDAAGDLRFEPDDPGAYDVVSLLGSPRPAQLRVAEDGAQAVPPHYLALPQLAPSTLALADSLTRTAGDRLAAAYAVQRWLHAEFGYTLDLPRTRAEATLEHFLFTRREGHCEYFSTAMVVLLRAAGIPARNVTGFLGGEWNEFGGYLIVRQNRAHSWVEVWFPGAGWVPFDPTPPGAGPASRLEDGWAGRTWGFFDGMQHRWYKWVIDYNLTRQIELFRGIGDTFRRDDARAFDPEGWGRRVLFAVVVLALLLAAWRGRAPGGLRRRPRATRAYLGLRSSYARRGLPRRGPPLDFLSRVEEAGLPGREEAGTAVQLYLRARFGGEPLSPAEVERLEGSVRAARRRLRAARRG